MGAPTLLQEKNKATGEATGALSTGRVLAWLLVLVVVALWVCFVGGLRPKELTFWRTVIGSGLLGVLSVGFYVGKGVQAFQDVTDAVARRVGQD